MSEVPDLQPGGFRRAGESFEPPAPLKPRAGEMPLPNPPQHPPVRVPVESPDEASRLPLVLGVGLLLFLLLAAATAFFTIPRIEDHLQTEALQRLEEAGINGATVDLDGRTATISGLSAADAERAEKILDDEWGIRDAKIAEDLDPEPVRVADTTEAPSTTTSEPEDTNETETNQTETDRTETDQTDTDQADEADEPEESATSLPEAEPDLDDELADLERRFNTAAAFAAGSAELSVEAQQILDDALELLANFPEAIIQVEGHTDNQGAVLDNLLLSQDRADAVTGYLVDNGIEPERLVALGLGANEPIADNSTEAGRAQNRRTEFAATR